jgi:DNA-binding winged helix-turn-helix (wHTH) protein
MERLDPASSGSGQTGYRFGEFRLEADGVLLRGETPVPLEPRELAALRLLLAHCGQIVTTLQLKQALRGDQPVASETVSKCLASLRRRLEPVECIETVPRRGYRFSLEAQAIVDESLPATPRLAILPFTAEYGVPEYLGPAFAEIAAARLGAVQPAVASVLTRDSVFGLAQSGLTPWQIGQMVKADLVLRGELHALASCFRLRLEMLEVRAGRQLWIEELLVDRTQILELERELVHKVARRLAGDGPSTSAAAVMPHPEPTAQQREAYELFARGRYEWQTLERHRMQDAVQHLERAIELDPDLTAARVNLADLCVVQALCGFVQPGVAAEMAGRAAGDLAGPLGGAEAILPALGWFSFHVDRNLPVALDCFARSAHLPFQPCITRARTMFALSRRRFGEAIELEREAIHLDPFSPWLHGRLAWTYHLAGESALSLQTALSAVEQFPGQGGPELYGAMILAFNGETSMAVNLAQALAQRFPYYDPAAAVHAYALATAGRADEAGAILERLQWLCRERYAMNTFSPAAYVALGRLDTALAELRAANDLRCSWFFQMLADPRLRPLHGLPEFESMNSILAGMETQVVRDAGEE